MTHGPDAASASQRTEAAETTDLRKLTERLRADGDVRQAILQAALHRHDVTHRRGVVYRPAERQPVADRRRKLAEQHVAAPVHADHVRVGHPDDIDPLIPEPFGNGGDVSVGRVCHGVLPTGRGSKGVLRLSLAGMIPGV